MLALAAQVPASKSVVSMALVSIGNSVRSKRTGTISCQKWVTRRSNSFDVLQSRVAGTLNAAGSEPSKLPVSIQAIVAKPLLSAAATWPVTSVVMVAPPLPEFAMVPGSVAPAIGPAMGRPARKRIELVLGGEAIPPVLRFKLVLRCIGRGCRQGGHLIGGATRQR